MSKCFIGIFGQHSNGNTPLTTLYYRLSQTHILSLSACEPLLGRDCILLISEHPVLSVVPEAVGQALGKSCMTAVDLPSSCGAECLRQEG